MTSLAVLIYTLSQNIDINYACKDQHIDATFENLNEAIQYVNYFKPHHHYKIIPVVKFYGTSKRTR